MNKEYNMLSDILCDSYDIKKTLPKEALNLPKDNDGTSFTIGDCLDNIIETLEEMTGDTNE